MASSFERTLEIEGTFNFRDVGHYVARDGRMTRPGVLYRSGAIHDLRPVGVLGVRTVVDLRGDADVDRDAGALGALREQAGVRRIPTPLIPTRVGEVGGHQYLNERFGPGISAGRYQGYLEIGVDGLRDVDLLGVPHETIVADYALSNASMPHLIAHLRGEPAEAVELSESDLARFGAPSEAMAGFLAHVQREHGSARSLLTAMGVEQSVFATLEQVLLGPA
jgi:protein-tyrosine phosphatase